MKFQRQICAFLLLGFASFSQAATSASSLQPNIIIVMTDDQGYGDLGFTGNSIIKTPNLDRFAKESVRFTDFHVSPTCAPTRAALMTGRHEFRSGVTHTILERERLSLKSTTIAQVLKSAGYTTGIFGKWHLGDEDAYQPGRRGFDEVFIHGAGGIGQTYPGSCGDAPGNTYFDPAIRHNGKFEKTKGYCTDVFFQQAVNWMDAKRKKKSPFFAYITPNAPHAPLQCPEEYARRYEGKVDANTARFYGMIENIDDNFGRLLAKLDEWKTADNTLVIFMTDNGGTAGVKVFNAGMRGQKNTPYEGGTRVPSFWRWPNGFQGNRDCNALTAHLDIFPTFAEISRKKISKDINLDGRSLLPLLKNFDTDWPDRFLFTHLGRWEKGKAEESKFAGCSVRDARFHFVNNTELYDLKSDPSEKKNVIAEHPEAVTKMRSAYDRWWNEIFPALENENVLGPKVNPFKAAYWKQFGGGPEIGPTEKSKTTKVVHPPSTPQEVWADFDPRSEPLEIEVLQRWTEHGANYTEFYFTGMTNRSEKVRVYAIYSAPVGGKNLPGILHIHGGGQTVNTDWLRTWNKRGYAALSFNWGGVWTNRPRVTLWGNLTQGNHGEARGKMETTDPSVRESSWYLWTRISRRALTALEQQPEVDANRLGIFGVSMGGTITWPFAAMDTRVKAACAIYGVGWLTYPDELGAPDLKANDASMMLWRKTMASEAYGPLVKCPILYLNATDDFYGKIDWAFRTLDFVEGKCRWSFTPRYNHHIAAEQGNNLPLWMDTWLKDSKIKWPKTPKATVTLDKQGVLQLPITPDNSRDVKKVELFYAIENRNPKNRFWRSVEGEAKNKTWKGSLPILDVNEPVFAFANVLYTSGICLSSPLVTKTPAKLGRAIATDSTSLLLGDFANGTDGWTTTSPTPDPLPPIPCLIVNAVGPDGRNGITTLGQIPLRTYKVGDPKWRAPDGAKLEFQIYSTTARDVKLAVYENEMTKDAKKFSANQKLTKSAEWRTVVLELKDFKTESGEVLSDWKKVKLLEVATSDSSTPQPIYSDVRWVP